MLRKPEEDQDSFKKRGCVAKDDSYVNLKKFYINIGPGVNNKAKHGGLMHSA